MLSWWIVWYGEPFLYFFVLYLLVVLSCKIAEVGFGWWAAAMIGLIVITTDPPQASHYQCHMSFKSKLNLSNPSSPITIPWKLPPPPSTQCMHRILHALHDRENSSSWHFLYLCWHIFSFFRQSGFCQQSRVFLSFPLSFVSQLSFSIFFREARFKLRAIFYI